jgi:hypothetical protein
MIAFASIIATTSSSLSYSFCWTVAILDHGTRTGRKCCIANEDQKTQYGVHEAGDDEDVVRLYNDLSGFQSEQTLEPWRSYKKARPDHAVLYEFTSAAGSSSRFLSIPLPMLDLVLSKSLPSQLSPNSNRLSRCYAPLPHHSTLRNLQRDVSSFVSKTKIGYSSANKQQ